MAKVKIKYKSYKGKSMRPGGGGQFQKMVDSMPANMPMSEKKAIAAKAGRKKYGKKRMAKFAAQGRKRAAKKRKGK